MISKIVKTPYKKNNRLFEVKITNPDGYEDELFSDFFLDNLNAVSDMLYSMGNFDSQEEYRERYEDLMNSLVPVYTAGLAFYVINLSFWNRDLVKNNGTLFLKDLDMCFKLNESTIASSEEKERKRRPDYTIPDGEVVYEPYDKNERIVKISVKDFGSADKNKVVRNIISLYMANTLYNLDDYPDLDAKPQGMPYLVTESEQLEHEDDLTLAGALLILGGTIYVPDRTYWAWHLNFNTAATLRVDFDLCFQLNEEGCARMKEDIQNIGKEHKREQGRITEFLYDENMGICKVTMSDYNPEGDATTEESKLVQGIVNYFNNVLLLFDPEQNGATPKELQKNISQINKCILMVNGYHIKGVTWSYFLPDMPYWGEHISESSYNDLLASLDKCFDLNCDEYKKTEKMLKDIKRGK